MKLFAGTDLDFTYDTFPLSSPGWSTEGGVGRGRIRYYGTGNFGSGERGYVGLRFGDGVDSYYGWAEVSAIDSTGMTIYQVAYEDEASVSLGVGDSGARMVGMWDGPRASMPAGWNSVSFTNDRFVYGAGTGEDPLTTGGSLTHTHSVNPPPTLTGNDFADTGRRNLIAGLNVADDNHKHEVNFPSQQSTPGSTLPDKVQKLVFMQGFAEAIPIGLIAMWFGAIADIPDGWGLCDGISSNFDLSDRFIMGAAHGEEPQAIDNGAHLHEVGFPTVTSSLPTRTIPRRGTNLQRLAHPNHTHNFAISVPIDPAEVLPPHTELAFIIRTGGVELPHPGMILMWSGAAAAIPEGWILCDGTNGTPDLRNQFVRATASGEEPGTTGGSATHVHTADPPPSNGSFPSSDVAQGAGDPNLPGDTHSHALDVPQFNTGSGSSIPPYVELVYVMRGPDPRTGVEDFADASGTPRIALHTPVPNPDHPATTIRFEVGRTSHVELAIYDTAGRRVRSLISSQQSPGSHGVRWDGRSDRGTPVAAGIYYARLAADGREVTRKLTVVR